MVGKRPDGSLVTHKLLSENPEQYRDAAVAGRDDYGHGDSLFGDRLDEFGFVHMNLSLR